MSEKLIYHLCLICGSQMFIKVSEYNQTLIDDEVSGVMYGCVSCDYAFSIDGVIDENDEDLYDENIIKKWTDVDWKKQKEIYLEANPEDANMLNYQKAVTKSFSKMYEGLKDV